MNTEPLRVVHFDADSAEEEHLRRAMPEGVDSRYVDAPLGEGTAERASEAEAITLFVHSRVTRAVLDRMPRLRFIAARSTGYDHIDLEACRERGISVSNVPTYGENTVAEHTFGLILALSRNIHKAWERTRRGEFSLEGLRGFDLQGKTLGLVGTGHIGLHAARIGRGFGMTVLAHDPRGDPFMADLVGFRYVTLGELLERSDIVSLHAPLTPATRHLLDRDGLAKMKPGALLVNTARGGLVDTEALLEALRSGRLGGAALDVFEGEELSLEEAALSGRTLTEEEQRLIGENREILERENVVMTPHMAFYSGEAEDRIRETTAANLAGFREGRPGNVVSAA
jgi:D-lactate dehydrogenase